MLLTRLRIKYFTIFLVLVFIYSQFPFSSSDDYLSFGDLYARSYSILTGFPVTSLRFYLSEPLFYIFCLLISPLRLAEPVIFIAVFSFSLLLLRLFFLLEPRIYPSILLFLTPLFGLP